MSIERLSPLATRSARSDVLFWGPSLVSTKAADALRSERQREIHVLHDGDEDLLHRMLNAMQPGSYVRPHRHADPPKAESIVVLQGEVGFVGFFDDGTIDPRQTAILAPGGERVGVDVRAGVWHTFFALAPDSVVFEVKAGPYRASTDKDFAPWAPAEGTPEAAAYHARLVERLLEIAGRAASGG